MPLAGQIYITHVHKTVPADIYFPEIDRNTWKIVEKEDSKSNKNGEFRIRILFTKEKKVLNKPFIGLVSDLKYCVEKW